MYANFEMLATILTESEAVINLRPLTYVYADGTEPEPLTPYNFLEGKRSTSLPTTYISVSEPPRSDNVDGI